MQQGTGLFGDLGVGLKKLTRQEEGLLSGTVCVTRGHHRSFGTKVYPVAMEAGALESSELPESATWQTIASDSAGGIRNPSSNKTLRKIPNTEEAGGGACTEEVWDRGHLSI